MRSSYALASLASALLVSCYVLPSNENEPHYGAECQVVYDSDDEEMPMSIGFNHDLGLSPDESRLTLDVWTYEEELLMGNTTAKMAPHTKFQLIISEPLGTKRVYLRDTGDGSVQSIDAEAYSSNPNPEYDAVNVVLDDQESPKGAWLNIIIGSSAQHGLRIFIQNVP